MINKVHMLRKQHKITQEALANMVGVTRQTIISIENGKYQASLLLACHHIRKPCRRRSSILSLRDRAAS